MIFIIKEYKSFNQYINLTSSSSFRTDRELQEDLSDDVSVDISVTKVIDTVNDQIESSKYNMRKIPIVFQNFSQFPAILNSFQQKYIQKRENSLAAYDFINQKIYLKKEFYEGYSLHERLREKGLSQSEVTNFVILHEIGHAIHHQQSISTGKFI